MRKGDHMKSYNIITLEKEKMALVLILDCESPFVYLQEIAQELNHRKYAGIIVFDELLHSGNSEERFIICRFEQGKFEMNSFQFYDVPKQDSLRGYMDSYMRQNLEELRASGLTSYQIKLLEKGCLV